MSTAIVERGRITDSLVAYLNGNVALQAAGVLVGDGIAPDRAGWPGGNSDVGSFVASVTVSTGEAVPRDRDDVRSRHTSWILQYGLRSVGAVRTQADHTADVARAQVLGFGQLLLPVPWTVTDVIFARLGAVSVAPNSDPPLWTVDDVVQIWIDRQRGVT